MGMKPADALMMPESRDGISHYRVGDCVNPGNAFEAIHQAFELALKI
jgi:hypothetical protein